MTMDGAAGDLTGERERELVAAAVRLAADNGAAGQLPFGALVVRAGQVVATGVNTALRDADPTAHAEVAAVRAACRALGVLHLGGAVIVSSCEPCALCHAAAVTAGVSRILYAAPSELVPDLRYPAPDGDGPLLAAMRGALRGLAPARLRHVPTPDAGQPFARYLERLP